MDHLRLRLALHRRTQQAAADAWQDDDEESQLSPPLSYEYINEVETRPPSAGIDAFQDDDEESQLSPPLNDQQSVHSPGDISQLSSPFAEPVEPEPLPPVIEVCHPPMYREVPSLSPVDILSAGLYYAGFDQARQERNNIARKTEWFKAFYGVEPTTVAPFFVDIKNDYPNIVFKDCLIAMNWLTLYDIFTVMSGRWKYSEEYIGAKVIEYLEKMSMVSKKKIVFKLNHQVELGYSVDCSTFTMQEFRLKSSTYRFDWKTHSCGVK